MCEHIQSGLADRRCFIQPKGTAHSRIDEKNMIFKIQEHYAIMDAIEYCFQTGSLSFRNLGALLEGSGYLFDLATQPISHAAGILQAGLHGIDNIVGVQRRGKIVAQAQMKDILDHTRLNFLGIKEEW